MGATVEGDDAVTRAVAGIVDDVPTLDAWQALAQEGEAIGGRLAPRRGGTLSAGVVGTTVYAGAVVGVRGRAARYAGPINYGWPRRHIRPSYFLQRTSDALEDRATTLLDNALTNQLTKRGLT